MAINLNIVSKFDDKGIKQIEGRLGGLGSAIGKIGGVIATAFSFRAVSSFVSSSVGAASSLEESFNAVNVAFGKSAEGILKFGENAATALGTSQVSFNNAAVRFSAFAERIVGEGEDVTGFIGDISTRATDFASVFNIDVAEALRVFQSGLAGEAEPLKRFGINLLDSEVKAYAAANGIGEIGKQLTETEKVQARYGLLMASTAKVQGDFANTSDGLANSQRILQANFADMKAVVGASLLPALAGLSAALVPIVEQMGPMLDIALRQATPAFTALAELVPVLIKAFLPLIPLFVDIVKIVSELAADILPVLVTVFEAILPVIAAILPVFGEFLKDLIKPLLPAITTLVEAFMPLLDAILPVLLELLNALLPVFTALLDDAVKALVPVITDLIAAFLPLLSATLPLLVQLLTDFVIPIIKTMGSVVTQVFGGAAKFIGEALGNTMTVLTSFAKAFGGVWTGISGFMKGIINGILGMIQGLVNGVIDGVNAVIRALNKIQFTVPSWVPGLGGEQFGFAIPQITKIKIPQLAEGGIVMPTPGGTLANIAEAGKPEAVIPLDRMGNMGKTVNLNITVNAGMGADGSEIGRKIVDEIVRYEKSSGRVFARA
jgi:phage-related protein